MEAVLAELEEVESMSARRLESRLNLRSSQIAKALKLLEVDGAVAHEAGSYFRTANPWNADTERIERVTQHRQTELAQMQTYVRHPGCLQEFLARALDDPTAAPCGRCANETQRGLPETASQELVERATSFFKRDARRIEPRSRWPSGAVAELKGSIVPAIEPGFALCVYGDAGWGRMVADGKYKTGIFDRRLAEAAADLIRHRWLPDPYPEWVTAVPSTRHPRLLGIFAQELARYLGLPFVEPLAAMEGPQQKTMENSAQQLRNVRKRIQVVSDVPPGPGLLVDDVVDSRWTLTYAGWLLRQHGAGPIYPFALAVASGRDDS
jgi:ATP-dependent DNA helicase RecQ